MYILKQVTYKNILDIPDLTIPSHKITCIVGKSGSGKTTLLRLLNKLIPYDNGLLTYNTQSLKELDSVSLRRQVVMMPQTPITFPGNIRDNLNVGLNYANKPIINDEHLQVLLKFVELNKKLDDSVEKLSGGEKQRLSLARVLVLEPHVLLLDEPSSSLDDHTEQLIIEKVVSYVRDNHKTLIMVTHSKSIADTYADFIVEIENGKIKHKEERR